MSNNDAPNPEALAAMIDSIKIFTEDHDQSLSPSEKKIVDNFPSKRRVLDDMDDAQRNILYRSVRHIWKTMTGREPEFESVNKDAAHLNGAYWMMPGGILLSGFNHFQIAKENKFLVCSLLNINPLVFEKMLATGDTGDVIMLILARGGVRTLINRDKQEVVMQTNEESWPWAKEKLEKMYHLDKVVKIIDLSQPYEGWKSGVTIRFNKNLV